MYPPHGILRIPLSIPAAAFFSVQKIREFFFDIGLLRQTRSPVPTISVGNIQMGGVGKTPFVVWLSNLLSTMGYHPAVVSRGYKGSYKSPFLVVGDSGYENSSDPLTVGDEPYLMYKLLRDVPIVVGRKRIDAVQAAHRLFPIDITLLDDGFQHLPLSRNVDIVLLNGLEDFMFPLGNLREPFSALRRADVVIAVNENCRLPSKALQYITNTPKFSAQQKPLGLVTETRTVLGDYTELANKSVLLFSAIANPYRFRRTAEGLGWKIIDHLEFADHYCPDDALLRNILEKAGKNQVVATEKDWVKLPKWFRELDNVCALRIGMVVDEEQRFKQTLLRLLNSDES